MSGEQLRVLLEDKAFVDYFNIFLSQPVFGFRIMYKLHEKKFIVDSKLMHSLEKITKSKLLTWLESERLPLFVQSPMYFEYNLCIQLRELELNKEVFAHTCDYGHLDETLIKLIVKNIFGHYVGMHQFKKFLTDTYGEKIWQCIQDVMLYCSKQINKQLKRYELHHLIMKYLANGTLYELSARLKLHLFLDSDRLKNLSVDDITSNGITFHECLFHNDMLIKEPEKAMLRLHSFLVQDMLNYWAPCFVLHMLQERISSNLECLCQLSFTETTGSLMNVLNLFDLPSRTCPMFMTVETDEISEMKFRQREQFRPSANIQEHLFGDEFLRENSDTNYEMVTILVSEKLSGHPFFKFLMETNGDMVFLLWEDLCKYMNIRNNNNAEYVKKLQEIKIRNIYLSGERKSQNNLLDDVIKQIISFKISEAKEGEKTSNLLKAIDTTMDILQKLWQKFIDQEMSNFKEYFKCQPKRREKEDEDEDEDEEEEEEEEEEDGIVFDTFKSFDQTSVVNSSLTLIDINQLRKDRYTGHNVISCLFRDEELRKISSLNRSRQRTYQLGKDIFKSLRASEKKFNIRPVKRINIPKSKITTIPFRDPEPQIRSMKLLFDLKAIIKGKKHDQMMRDKPKLRNIGVNPYLSLRKMDAFNIMDLAKRRRLVFQKYLKLLCQFLHEILQPYMRVLLLAYVDEISKKSQYQEDEQKAAEKYSKFMKRKLNRQLSVFRPTPIYYARLKKKILYLSESLRFKLNAYTMLTSGQRSKINLRLKNKARHIITTFQEGSLFAPERSAFGFGCAKDPTNDLAADVALKLKSEGASCALFHKLDLHVIPAVYQIWKRMGLDCMLCGGRQKFLAAMGIDRVSFDKKVAAAKKRQQMFTVKPEKTIKGFKINKIQMEEQASLLASSLLTFFDDTSDKYQRHFAYSVVECLSPDLRKIMQHRGGSQLEYVLVR